MRLDWEAFLQQHSIDYRQRSGNQLLVACPWCNDGGSPNMSINLNGKGWRCWANPDHSGLHPARLMVAVAGISPSEAHSLCGSEHQHLGGDPRQRVAELLFPQPRPLPQLQLADEFRALTHNPLARPFVDYLCRRGFQRQRVFSFTADYGLYYAHSGMWRYRIIFTVHQQGKLRSWTGRSIVNGAEPRYLALGKERSGSPLTDFLPWFDELRAGGKRLVLCEGPFDALKLRELGQPATCFFTAAPSPAQIALLVDLLPRWRERILLLDRGTTAVALSVQRNLAGLGVQVRQLPAGIKDPGELASADFLTVTRT